MGSAESFEYLKQNGVNSDALNPEMLAVFNKLKEQGDIFPKVVMRKAVEELMASDPFFSGNELDGEARIDQEYIARTVFDTPEAKQAYVDEFISLHFDAVKDEIMTNPNKYYTEDIFKDYAGIEKTTEQGIAQPNTGA